MHVITVVLCFNRRKSSLFFSPLFSLPFMPGKKKRDFSAVCGHVCKADRSESGESGFISGEVKWGWGSCTALSVAGRLPNRACPVWFRPPIQTKIRRLPTCEKTPDGFRVGIRLYQILIRLDQTIIDGKSARRRRSGDSALVVLAQTKRETQPIIVETKEKKRI